MKKLIFFCLSFLVALEGVSQSCGDDGFWKIGSQFGTQRLSSNCGDFICHGFAAAYWEQGFTQGTSLNSTNPGIVNIKTQYTQSGGGPTETYFWESIPRPTQRITLWEMEIRCLPEMYPPTYL
jgi:hypothetical protein